MQLVLLHFTDVVGFVFFFFLQTGTPSDLRRTEGDAGLTWLTMHVSSSSLEKLDWPLSLL